MTYRENMRPVKDWVLSHAKIEKEPVLLAVYFDAENDGQDIHLLEVIDNFGYNEVNPEREIFEVEYKPTPEFRLPKDARVHLLLTNPREYEVAIRDQWPGLGSFQQAVQRGRYDVVLETEDGKRLLLETKGAAAK